MHYWRFASVLREYYLGLGLSVWDREKKIWVVGVHYLLIYISSVGFRFEMWDVVCSWILVQPQWLRMYCCLCSAACPLWVGAWMLMLKWALVLKWNWIHKSLHPPTPPSYHDIHILNSTISSSRLGFFPGVQLLMKFSLFLNPVTIGHPGILAGKQFQGCPTSFRS